MSGLDFLTVVILAFAIVLAVAGVFTIWFGVNKSKIYGSLMTVFGIVLGIVWVILCGTWGIMDPVIDVDVPEVFMNALVNFIGVVLGALIGVVIFLFSVLKS